MTHKKMKFMFSFPPKQFNPLMGSHLTQNKAKSLQFLSDLLLVDLCSQLLLVARHLPSPTHVPTLFLDLPDEPSPVPATGHEAQSVAALRVLDHLGGSGSSTGEIDSQGVLTPGFHAVMLG